MFHILPLYFAMLGLSPLWGLHSHNDSRHAPIVHSHNETVPSDTSNHSHEKEIPISVFEYLLVDKATYQINDNYIDLEVASNVVLLQSQCVVLYSQNGDYGYSDEHKLFRRLLYSSSSPRAPPI